MDTYFAQFSGLSSAPIIRTRNANELDIILQEAARIIQYINTDVYVHCYIFKNGSLDGFMSIKRTTVFVKEAL